MAHPARLQAEVVEEVVDLLPQGYWATSTAFPESVFGSVQIDVHLRVDKVTRLSTRPVFQLSVGEYNRPDRFETARYIKGRLTTVGRLEWQPFPDLRTAVLNLITQHRLGVGNV